MNLRRFALISDQPLLIATNTKTDGDKVPPQTFSWTTETTNPKKIVKKS